MPDLRDFNHTIVLEAVQIAVRHLYRCRDRDIQDFSRETGIDQARLEKILDKEVKATREELTAICQVLDTTVEHWEGFVKELLADRATA